MKILDRLFNRAEPAKPAPMQALEKAATPATARGKAVADLYERGWETISGLPNFRNAGSVWETYSDRDGEQAYGAHALVYACMRRIANSLCEAPLEVVAGVGDTEEVLAGHPALDVVNNPNRFYSRNDLLRYWIIRLLATGRGYVWKWRKKSGQLGELWPVPTSWVREIPGAQNNLIDRYEIRQVGTGGVTPVKLEDMIRAVLVDPATMTGGVGPLQAAQHDYQLDLQRENYLVEMLSNAHVPGLHLHSATRKLTPKEKDELRAAAGDRAGIGKRGSTLITDLGLEATILEPLKDMDWPGVTDLTEARICSALGVPPILVQARIGIKSGAQYANYETARRSFYAETLNPMWGETADWLTMWLLRVEGETRLRFRFNTEKIAALQEAAGEKSLRVRADWQAGLIKRNQALTLMGYKTLDDTEGEVFYIPPGATISEDGNSPPPPEPQPFPPQFGQQALPEPDEETEDEADAEKP